jgi:hypothetical protein
MIRVSFSASILVLALASTGVVACVGGSTETTQEDKERLKQYVLDKAPDNIGVKQEIKFDDKVTMLGYKIEPAGAVKPGGHAKVTMYWRCDKKLGEGWNLFTHVLDGSGERVLNIDNVGPLREWRGDKQIMGPSQWEPGKIYVDEQDFTMPANVKTDKVQFVTGVWKDNDRLKIASGPHDRENRAIVAHVATGVRGGAQQTALATRVPRLRIDKLDKPAKLVFDGKLDEEAWRGSRVAGPFLDVATGRPNPSIPLSGSVKVMFDDTNLYLGFDIHDPDVIGGFDKEKDKKDPHLWTKDTIEVMIDPDGDGDNKDYYEIQVNPQGLVFDSQFDDYGSPKKEPNGPFGHQEWESKLKAGVAVNGTLDKPGDRDAGYVVEVAIPWKSFGKAKNTPPKPGDIWRLNFYAVQANQAVSWSSIQGQGTFHKASRFGQLMFANKDYVPPVPFGFTSPMLPSVPQPEQRPGVVAPIIRGGPGLPRLRSPSTVPNSAKPANP